MRSLWFVVVVATGCVESSAFICGDGVVCPAGYRCEEALSRCIDPMAEAACVGVTEGEPCAVRGLTGVCASGLCELSICGNGVVEIGEDCDGENLDGKTCSSLLYYGETTGLACNKDCTYYRAGCQGFCGDGVINGGEICDTADLRHASEPRDANCKDVGFYAEPGLGCSAGCTWDITDCTGGRCGDNVKNGGELCDGNLPTESCFDVGLDIGTLTCSACGFGFAGCGRFGWQLEATLPAASAPYAIHGVLNANNVLEAWVGGDTGQAKRFDGTQWIAATIGAANVRSIWVAGVGAAWASDSNGALWRWNGTTWALHPSAPMGVTGVWGTSATDVWVITATSGVKQWNGSVWTDKGGVTQQNLVSIHGSSTNDIWIATAGDAQTTDSLLRRWNGTSWSAPTTLFPNNPSVMTDIRAVFAISATDAWAVGTNGSQKVLAHWNGSSWTRTVRAGSPGVVYTSITGSATNDVWASHQTGVEHFDGYAWIPVTAPAPARLFEAGPGHVLAADIDSIDRYSGLAYGENDPSNNASPSTLLWSTDDGHILMRHSVGTQVLHFDGQMWLPETVGNSAGPAAAWGTSASSMWIAGSDSYPYRYTGGVPPWVRDVNANPLYPRSNMWGSGPSDIWYGGADGDIRHFGGTTWSPRDIASSGTVKKIWGSGPNDVWALLDIDNDNDNDKLFRWTGSWSEVTNVPMPPEDMVVVGPNQVIVISNHASWHGNAAGWTKQELPNVASSPTNLVARDSDMVFGASGTELFHHNGTRWTLVRMPAQPVLAGPLNVLAVALTQNRLDLSLTALGNPFAVVRSLVITQAWRCVASETGLCTDGVDNDCDGTLDDRDTECP